MRMETGLDTGPVCLRREVAIEADDTAGTLHDRLAALGAEAIVAALEGLEAGTLTFTPQPEAGVTYARKIEKSEAAIDWALPAVAVAARIRAFDPAPGCSSRLASAPETPLRLFRPRVVSHPPGVDAATLAAEPGRVIAATGDGVVIACGEQALTINDLQRPGGRRLTASAYLAGHRIVVGDYFISAGQRAAATS
jgi:methionyl-tRNA formyltransferase